MSGYRTDVAISTGVGYSIVENASLEGRNTFRVAARASMLVDVRDAAALPELFAFDGLRTQPLLVLGEGSNILFAGDWPGVVLSMATRGIDTLENNADDVLVRVAAGENWNDFVYWCLAHEISGLENLVLIPGTVGGAPIQNIGAYGVEVGDSIERVHVWDRDARLVSVLEHAECRFAYRDSVFKQQPARYLVVAVEFRLPRTARLHLGYAGIVEEIAALGAGEPTIARVAEAVSRLRLRKLPNPALIGNAGSFFKNPLIDSALAQAIGASNPTCPTWPAGSRTKLSAAWLIDACGMKGYRDGDAGVSDLHALVLVNHGRASGADLLRVARKVAS
ncbi:MAG: UDP-N-acetylmuramate dehydrogenase, partial [Dokdonella sp.]